MAYTGGPLDITHAWVHLTRLDGCNYKQRVTHHGKSVFITDPQIPERSYRLNAAKFDAGEYQHRSSWTIVPWSAYAEATTLSQVDHLD